MAIEDILKDDDLLIHLDVQPADLEFKRKFHSTGSYDVGFFCSRTDTLWGVGRYVQRDGKVKEGLWKNDKLIGKGKIYLKSGKIKEINKEIKHKEEQQTRKVIEFD